jgi:hypothetical protein
MEYIELLNSTDNKNYFKVLFEAGMAHEKNAKKKDVTFYKVVECLKRYNDRNQGKNQPEILFNYEEATDMIENHLKNSTNQSCISIQDFTNALRMYFPKNHSEPFIYYLVNIYKEMDLNTAESYIADNNANAITSFFTNNYPIMFETDFPSQYDTEKGQKEVLKLVNKHCKDILHLEDILVTQSYGIHPKTRVYCVSSTTEPIDTKVMFNILKSGLKLLMENENVYKNITDENYIVPQEFVDNIKDLALYHKLDAEVPKAQKTESAFKI